MHFESGLVQKCLKTGWTSFQKQPWPLVLSFLILMTVTIGLNVIIPNSWNSEKLLINTAIDFISGIFFAGYSMYCLKLVRGRKGTYDDIFMGFQKPIPIMLASFLVFFCIIFGFVLFVIPGILAMLRFSQVFYFILDQDAGVLESFSKSNSAMKGHNLELMALYSILLIVNLIGFLALGVGLLLTVPFTYAAFAVFYKEIVKT